MKQGGNEKTFLSEEVNTPQSSNENVSYSMPRPVTWTRFCLVSTGVCSRHPESCLSFLLKGFLVKEPKEILRRTELVENIPEIGPVHESIMQ